MLTNNILHKHGGTKVRRVWYNDFYTSNQLFTLANSRVFAPHQAEENLLEGWYKFPNASLHFSGETRCCPTATSERRRICSSAETRFFALREVGDRATEKVSI